MGSNYQQRMVDLVMKEIYQEIKCTVGYATISSNDSCSLIPMIGQRMSDKRE